MSKPTFTQAQIDAFLKSLTTWAQSLPADQQAMAGQLISQAKSGEGVSLSNEQLDGVVGGLSTIMSSLGIRRTLAGEWMRWVGRQY